MTSYSYEKRIYEALTEEDIIAQVHREYDAWKEYILKPTPIPTKEELITRKAQLEKEKINIEEQIAKNYIGHCRAMKSMFIVLMLLFPLSVLATDRYC